MIRAHLTTFLWLFLAGFIFAQRLPDADIPPPPITGILDDGDILGKNSGAGRRISSVIQDLRTKHGYEIYLALERSLIGTNSFDFSAQLQDEWAADGSGLVIVYESDTKRLGFGRELGGNTGEDAKVAKVPSYRLQEIISDAALAADGEEITEVYLETLVVNIATGLDEYFTKKESPKSNGRSLRLALVTIGALSLLALCGMGLGWLMGKADKKQTVNRRFPATDIPERLGAPYGGGGGASSFFGSSERK